MKASAKPSDSGLATGVKRGTRLGWVAKWCVSYAVLAEPLSESHSTGVGARGASDRCSTVSSIRSRASDPLIPIPTTSPPGEDLAVMRIDHDGDTHDLPVPAQQLQDVRAPAQVGAHHHHLAVMEPSPTPDTVASER